MGWFDEDGEWNSDAGGLYGMPDVEFGDAGGGGWGFGDWFGGGGGGGMDPMMMGASLLGGLLGKGGGGTRVSVNSTSTANNNIAFNPVIQAITGMGNPSSPAISAPTSTSISPTSNANSSGSDSNSSGLGGLLGSSFPAGRIDTSQAYPTAGLGGNGVSLGVKTNSQTMLWMMLFGGFAIVLLMPSLGGGGRRH